jgi:hypothetical protein
MIIGPCRQRLPLTVDCKGAGGLTCLDWPFRPSHLLRHRHHESGNLSLKSDRVFVWTPADLTLANMLALLETFGRYQGTKKALLH